jgi:hypothetical protein
VIVPKAPSGHDELSENAIPFDEAGTMSMSTYPNPIKRGDQLNLEYALGHEALASMTIVDMSGRTVYERTASVPEGRSILNVSTEGWSSGSYVINVAIGGTSQSKRIVVIDGK